MFRKISCPPLPDTNLVAAYITKRPGAGSGSGSVYVEKQLEETCQMSIGDFGLRGHTISRPPHPVPQGRLHR